MHNKWGISFLDKASWIKLEAQMCLFDVQEPMRFVLTCQTSMTELLLIICGVFISNL